MRTKLWTQSGLFRENKYILPLNNPVSKDNPVFEFLIIFAPAKWMSFSEVNDTEISPVFAKSLSYQTKKYNSYSENI